MSVAIGCSEYNFKSTVPHSDDTGPVPPELPDCLNYESPGGNGHVVPGLGWGTDDVCYFSQDEIVGIYPTSMEMIKATVNGGASSADPGINPVRLVGVPSSGSYPSAYNIPTGDLEAVGTTGSWSAVGTGIDLDAVNACGGECAWSTFMLEVKDTTRADYETCDDYVPSLEVCFDWAYLDSDRAAPVYSTCAAGSGRFQLIPYRVINRDHDGDVSTILRAIQKSGTAVMTGAAWITEIEVVEDQGKTLRVVRKDQKYSFAPADNLVNANTVSAALTQTTTMFNEGIITGGAPFVIEEIPDTTDAEFVVDMEWTCGDLLTQDELTPSSGYTFSMDDVDCLGSWPQKVTIRPVPYIGASFLRVELYGLLNDHILLPLTTTQYGKAFSYSGRDFDIQGRLIDYDGEGAVVALDVIDIGGVEMCEPDTYTFNLEE